MRLFILWSVPSLYVDTFKEGFACSQVCILHLVVILFLVLLSYPLFLTVYPDHLSSSSPQSYYYLIFKAEKEARVKQSEDDTD